MRERKLTLSNRQVCIHKDWWTKIIWNKDKECYYTNGLLKRLHDYNETDSEEESQDSNTEEPTIDQQIRQTLINPMLKTSPLITTTKLPGSTMTMTTEQTTITMATYDATAPTQSQSQRIASAMQQVFKQKKPGGGSGLPGGDRSGLPGGGGSGLPGGGGSGLPGGGGGPPVGGQPLAAQQPVPPTADVKAMGSLPQIFYGDRSKADDFIEEVKGYFRLNADIPGYNSPYKKVAFTLTLIKGKETAQWV